MSVSYLVGDVFDRLAELPDNSVDLVVTSPPFLALRSYLPDDHPNKEQEIGGEPNPAAFIDVLLAVTTDLRRVLAPHGSIAVELGDTYSGSGGAGGDYNEDGLREGQPGFKQQKVTGWPQAKSLAMIPESYRWALSYGRNPFNWKDDTSPAGEWIVRNTVRWVRPNPPVGRLGDKWRPATSDIVIACTSPNRYWDDLATRKPHVYDPVARSERSGRSAAREEAIDDSGLWETKGHPAGAPLLDWWEIVPGGFTGAHYAVYPPELVEPLVKAMCPETVCRKCGEPSRRIMEREYEATTTRTETSKASTWGNNHAMPKTNPTDVVTVNEWTDCGCNSDHCSAEYPCDEHWRHGIVLDPFAGSGTTLHVADALGRDAIGIDIDERNKTIYENRRDERRFNELRQLTIDV